MFFDLETQFQEFDECVPAYFSGEYREYDFEGLLFELYRRMMFGKVCLCFEFVCLIAHAFSRPLSL